MGHSIEVSFPFPWNRFSICQVSELELQRRRNREIIEAARQQVFQSGNIMGLLGRNDDDNHKILGAALDQEYWDGVRFEGDFADRPHQAGLLREYHDAISEVVSNMRDFYEGRGYTESWISSLNPELRDRVLQDAGKYMIECWLNQKNQRESLGSLSFNTIE